ncbi:conserved hypothetical protein [Xenorhabdus nematophila F1]|uniref:Uncharacterized protein n=1 Tax=Xenorhabdus nematophila (strain ATCC 19061 / DSM 3370 / CCUG 14189 / LMG 1036 / NCIMB 9965 / AN6) TaxID=406817 RepID=D3VBT5_XENNA|nr:hypothetical protein XNC1_3896 [Xenorhabdus nematophila ATCC 19061]CCW31657.1 conserved hypothetical protein [Xenorhabdus nematophila F1]
MCSQLDVRDMFPMSLAFDILNFIGYVRLSWIVKRFLRSYPSLYISESLVNDLIIRRIYYKMC